MRYRDRAQGMDSGTRALTGGTGGMALILPILAFLLLGWFGAKLINMGLAGITEQVLEVGFGSQFRGRTAVIVGTVLLLAGLLVIAPFVWGIAHLLGDVISRHFSSPG
jgi:uncharacterized protein (DUF697 family)